MEINNQMVVNEIKEVTSIVDKMLTIDMLSTNDVLQLYTLITDELETNRFTKQTPLPIFVTFLNDLRKSN